MSNPRIAGVADNAEGSIADIPTRIHELRVVEDVEELKTHIEGEIVLDLRVLQYAEIGVDQAGTIEEAQQVSAFALVVSP